MVLEENEMSKVDLCLIVLNVVQNKFQEYVAWKQDTLANQTGHLEVLATDF